MHKHHKMLKMHCRQDQMSAPEDDEAWWCQLCFSTLMALIIIILPQKLAAFTWLQLTKSKLFIALNQIMLPHVAWHGGLSGTTYQQHWKPNMGRVHGKGLPLPAGPHPFWSTDIMVLSSGALPICMIWRKWGVVEESVMLCMNFGTCPPPITSVLKQHK